MNMQKAMITFMLSVALIVVGPNRALCGEKRAKDDGTLTPKEEATVRDSVYKGVAEVANSNNGPYAGHHVLLVPGELAKVHRQKKKATLLLLIKIVEGARPRDAALAAGLGLALSDSPVLGGLVAQAAVDGFDVVSQRGTTMREHLVRMLANKLQDGEGKR
jgi:hypothetical protein